jgi:hypothetical protein
VKLLNFHVAHIGGFFMHIAAVTSASSLIILSEPKPELILPVIDRYQVIMKCKEKKTNYRLMTTY